MTESTIVCVDRPDWESTGWFWGSSWPKGTWWVWMRHRTDGPAWVTDRTAWWSIKDIGVYEPELLDYRGFEP